MMLMLTVTDRSARLWGKKTATRTCLPTAAALA